MKIFRSKQQSTDADAARTAQEVGAKADDFTRYSHPKAARGAALADALAELLRLGDEDRSALRLGALLHDVGMLAMRRDYVARMGALTAEERLDLTRHPVVGEGEAARLGFSRATQLIVRWHHEWWCGDGYPDGLRGEQIPLAARIMRVADAYCALTDARPWREAWTRDAALEHMRADAGLEFDPRIVHLLARVRTHAALISYAANADTREHISLHADGVSVAPLAASLLTNFDSA